MNNQYSTVIAAISTAMSNSGIGIVRMSGVGSFEIADRIYKGKREKNCLIRSHIPFIMDMSVTVKK